MIKNFKSLPILRYSLMKKLCFFMVVARQIPNSWLPAVVLCSSSTFQQSPNNTKSLYNSRKLHYSLEKLIKLREGSEKINEKFIKIKDKLNYSYEKQALTDVLPAFITLIMLICNLLNIINKKSNKNKAFLYNNCRINLGFLFKFPLFKPRKSLKEQFLTFSFEFIGVFTTKMPSIIRRFYVQKTWEISI